MDVMELAGQHLPLTRLLKAYTSGAIPHSYLFTGMQGTGKYSRALWFAALLACEAPRREPPAPCGTCSSCRKIGSSNHPDVRTFGPEPDSKTLAIKIDQIRELQREAVYLPAESKWKVFIIDQAHRMLDGAANCLLKTLEEPLPHMICILVSPTIYSLLPTIISRCQIIRFYPVPADEVTGILEKRGIPAKEARLFSRISQGSVGKAVDLCCKEQLWKGREQFLNVISQVQSLSAQELMLLVNSFPRNLEDLELLLDFTLLWLRDLLLFKETGQAAYMINIDRHAHIEEQAAMLSPWQIFTSIGYVTEAMGHVRSRATPELIIERLFLSLSKVQNTLNYG